MTTLRFMQLVAVVIPLLVAGIMAVWAWHAEHDAAAANVLRNARLVASYGERVLSSLDRLLLQAESLATPERLATDRAGLAAELRALTEGDGHAIGLGLVAADGRFLVTDRTAEPRVDARQRDYYEQLRDGDLVIFIDRQIVQPSGADALVVARRRSAERFAGLLVTAARIAVFTDFLGTLAGEQGARASLIRSDGRLLVRDDPALPPLMLEPPAPALEVIAGTRPAVYAATAQADDTPRLYATLPVEGFPLFASFGLPQRAIRAAWGWRMLMIVAGLAALSALSLLALGELRRRLQHEADAAEVAQSRETADRRAMLYQELNHRVKNSLQLIESLLRLHGRERDAGSRDLLDDIARRVHAIAEVHRQLDSVTGDGSVDVARLLRRLTSGSGIAPPERGIEVHCSAEPVELPADRAIPLALIVVEAVTNAVKHAFPEDRPAVPAARVEVMLRVEGPMARLAVSDNGIGQAAGLPPDQGLGLRLLDALAGQLGGSIERFYEAGTTLVVTFPLVRVAPAA
ncbi:MAG: histidine kinase dimerization/phosphoacceptor domain -containing protein [Geminicoccaceae bacterium]